MAKPLVVDADGHILEPPDTYERYIEPKYRPRAMRLKFDDQGLEYVEIDGKQSVMMRGGVLGNLGGAYMNAEELFTPGKHTYWEVAQRYPGAIDPDARVRDMDEQGIDIAVLYPTLGIVWEEDNKDPELSAAYCRAYNNYLIDFCSRHPDRLIAIAHVNLRDVDLAVAEMQRVKDKVKGVFYTPFPGNGRSPGSPYYDRFWGAAEAFGLPVSTHVQGRETYPRPHFGGPEFTVVLFHATARRDPAFTQLRDDGGSARALSAAQIRGAGDWLRMAAVLDGAGRRKVRGLFLRHQADQKTQPGSSASAAGSRPKPTKPRSRRCFACWEAPAGCCGPPITRISMRIRIRSQR